ncbi:MAG: hypothetical protein FWF03_01050 [Defluviitaleaceae bacterium]|nr:hypothetical protein [Defluviitaleaceae bacterium]
MVKFIAGGKGEGKTKRIIDMANACAKTTDGRLVFIDDDKRHIFDLNHVIRFVETGKKRLSTYKELIGFVLGILSMDSDIKHIFIDGLTNIIETIDDENLVKLISRLNIIAASNDVEFVVCANFKAETLPDEIKAILI